MDGQRSRADCFAYWNCDPIFGSKYLEANIDGPVCKDDHNATGTDGCELLQRDEDGHNVTRSHPQHIASGRFRCSDMIFYLERNVS